MAAGTAALALAAPAQAGGTSNSAVANNGDAATSQDRSGSRMDRGMQALEAGCPKGPATYDIGPGDTGTAVREVQCLLNWTLSWYVYPYDIAIDGNYGPVTTGAVKVFQTCANNRGAGISVDGRVGRQTLPHLRWWGQYSYDTGVLMC
ncbi:peptidoglycan-binding protein [Micromonospora sp. NPDC093277]|uniref:peptidoglycan-binding domain-containing protein n=1 Tax=Micromonospora sp. NPDC093277 TaxID=3364291 RepID=UPI00382290EE